MLRHTLSAYAAIYENECMRKHTTFGIGGTVDMMVVPHTTDDIPLILKACAQAGKRVIILGNGSNLLFPDEHLDVIVLKNQNCLYELCGHFHLNILSFVLRTAHNLQEQYHFE